MSKYRPRTEDRLTRELRDIAWEKQAGRCHWCAVYVPREEATGDHLRAYADGGRATTDNIVMACEPCNHARSKRMSASPPITEAELVRLLAGDRSGQQ